MGRRRKFSDAAFLNAVRSSSSVKQAAHKLRCSIPTIYHRLTEMGMTPDEMFGANPVDGLDLLPDFRGSVTIRDLATLHRIVPSQVRHILWRQIRDKFRKQDIPLLPRTLTDYKLMEVVEESPEIDLQTLAETVGVNINTADKYMRSRSNG